MNNQRLLLTGVGNLKYHLLVQCLTQIFSKEEQRIYLSGLQPEIDTRDSRVRILHSPRNSDVRYIEWVKEVIDRLRITDVIPCIDSEVEFFSINKDVFPKVNVWTSTIETVKLCVDKWAMYQHAPWLCPESWKASDKSELAEILEIALKKHGNVIVKPRSGINGSGKGVSKISKSDESAESVFAGNSITRTFDSGIFLDFYDHAAKRIRIPDLIISEYLPGEEYSVYVVCNQGKVIDISIHLKLANEVSSTSSGLAETIESSECRDFVMGICESFSLHLLNNIQIRRSNTGELKLVEINPRMAGSSALAEISGRSLISIANQIVNGQKVIKKERKQNLFLMQRATAEYYQRIPNQVYQTKSIRRINEGLISNDFDISVNELGKYGAVICDFDGTLYSQFDHYTRVIRRLLEQSSDFNTAHIDSALEEFDSYYRANGNYLIFDEFIKRRTDLFGTKSLELQNFLEMLEVDFYENVKIYPAALRFLEILKLLKIPSFIATDGELARQMKRLELLGIFNFIDRHSVMSLEKNPKPSLEALSKNFIEFRKLHRNDRVLVVGNSIEDFEFAEKLECDFMLLTDYPYHSFSMLST